MLERARGELGFPLTIRVDQGSEFISKDLALWAYRRGVALDFSRQGKPTDTASVESFNDRMRDELLNETQFCGLDHAKSVIARWDEDCNTARPHSAGIAWVGVPVRLGLNCAAHLGYPAPEDSHPMQPTPATFTPEQLLELTEILKRANPAAEPAEATLGEEILDLLYAVGTTHDGSEHAYVFAAAAANDLSHADLARQFQAIAASDDPLSPQLCCGIALSKLSAVARVKWSKKKINRPNLLRGVSSAELTEAELADIKEMALHLAAFHQSHVRRERPRKDDQDTLIEGLSDVYVRALGLDIDRYDLPHSVSSIFITFCHAALSPFFGLTEVSPKALSNRWKRLKDLAASARS